jgi:hypothetical protein
VRVLGFKAGARFEQRPPQIALRFVELSLARSGVRETDTNDASDELGVPSSPGLARRRCTLATSQTRCLRRQAPPRRQAMRHAHPAATSMQPPGTARQMMQLQPQRTEARVAVAQRAPPGRQFVPKNAADALEVQRTQRVRWCPVAPMHAASCARRVTTAAHSLVRERVLPGACVRCR